MKIQCLDTSGLWEGRLTMNKIYEGTPCLLSGEPAYWIQSPSNSFYAWRFKELVKDPEYVYVVTQSLVYEYSDKFIALYSTLEAAKKYCENNQRLRKTDKWEEGNNSLYLIIKGCDWSFEILKEEVKDA